jgi:hypothetical protein
MQNGNGYELVIPANDNQNRKPIMFGISWNFYKNVKEIYGKKKDQE